MNTSRVLSKLSTLSALSVLLTAASAQTGTLNVYLSPPAIQSSTVSGVTTETFDALSAGIHTTAYAPTGGIGTYTGSSNNPFAIMAPDEFGGATDSTHTSATNYLGVGSDSKSTSPVILKLATFPLKIRKAGTDVSVQSGQRFPLGREADAGSVSVLELKEGDGRRGKPRNGIFTESGLVQPGGSRYE